MGISENVDPTAISNVRPAFGKAEAIANHGKAQQADEATDNFTFLVAIVYYKPTVDRKSQIREPIRIHSVAKKQLNRVWKDEGAIFAQYQAYNRPFIDMPSQFKSMWDGHLGRIAMTRHRIELL